VSFYLDRLAHLPGIEQDAEWHHTAEERAAMALKFVARVQDCSESAPRTSFRSIVALATVICVTVCITTTSVGGEEAKEKPAPITEAEARAFADAVSKAIADQDLKTWNTLIDWSAMAETATADPDDPRLTEAKRVFRPGVVQRFRSSGAWMPEIGRAITNGGSYKCVLIKGGGAEPYVLFRMIFNPAGVTYQRYFLARNPAGGIVAKDLYTLGSGERFSESLHRTWMTAVAQAEDKVAGRTSGRSEHLRKMAEFTSLVVQGKHDQAVEKYHQLPADLKRDKNMLLMRYKAGLSVSDEEYQAAITDIRKYYPEDPSLDLLLIDLYIDRENYDEALACLDRLYRHADGDAYIDVMRANVLCKQKRLQTARAAFERAIRAEPDLPDAYYAGIGVSLAERKFDEVVRHLTKLEESGQELTDLTEVPEYAPFVKSPEYTEWTKSREKKSRD
jgi:tetratricopeptide (TPR) repeat protein